MRFWVFVVLLMASASCCDKHLEASYEYEEVVIRRLDKCGVTEFYYGDISDQSPKISAEYSGINDGFSGYLIFMEDGKVLLLSGDGYFQSANIDTTKFEYKRVSYEEISLKKGVYIMLATNVERERNADLKNGIEVNYDD